MIYINLAPLKYKAILNHPKSPIQKIDIIRTESSRGSKYFEAYGWLKNDFKYSESEKSSLYGTCEATGTDKYLQLALWKCISELVERWAFHHLLIVNSSNYGMSIDKTSTGFAALPCWPKHAVRDIAQSEAIERWAISRWWRGYLSAFIEVSPKADGDIGVVRINISPNIGNVVIVFKKFISKNKIFYVYGFAFGKKLKDAVNKASVELIRNEKVLIENSTVKVTSINDRRLMYFATSEGFLHFFSKVKTAESNFSNIPDPVIDCEIPGDWSRFATVWRCLLPDTNYSWFDSKHFMF